MTWIIEYEADGVVNTTTTDTATLMRHDETSAWYAAEAMLRKTHPSAKLLSLGRRKV